MWGGRTLAGAKEEDAGVSENAIGGDLSIFLACTVGGVGSNHKALFDLCGTRVSLKRVKNTSAVAGNLKSGFFRFVLDRIPIHVRSVLRVLGFVRGPTIS